MEQKKSQIYRIYEMRDEMDKGISNLQKVINQQNELITLLRKNDEYLSEDLKKFRLGLEDQLQKYYDQLSNIDKRKHQLAEFIEWYEKVSSKDELEVMLSELFEALFNNYNG